MYFEIISQFAFSLKNLDRIMGKAADHAEAKKFDVNNFLSARVAPDMLPFNMQVRIACDAAKGAAASLSGKEAPKHEDNETTFAELRTRIGKCITYLESFTAQDFAQMKDERTIKLAYPPGKGLTAKDFALGRQIPNFFFHYATAYGLLRAGGVEIGKGDFLGPLNTLDL